MKLRRTILYAIAKEMKIIPKSKNVEILEIVSKLVKTTINLQKYTKNTKSMHCNQSFN